MKKIQKKTRKYNKTKKLVKGGLRINVSGVPPLPVCDTLAIYHIDDSNIYNFFRGIDSPMDCFINALQIIGILNRDCSNYMRISSSGKTGFTTEEIEKTFILFDAYNYEFSKTYDINQFNYEIDKLSPNECILAGYATLSFSHVFIIARNQSGVLIVLDPQLSGQQLSQGQQSGIIEYSKYYIPPPLFGVWYHILVKSSTKITDIQARAIGLVV